MRKSARIALGMTAFASCGAVVTDAWLMDVEDELVAGIAVLGFVVTAWIAGMLYRDAVRQRSRAHMLAGENEALKRDKNMLLGLADWLTNSVTVPMQRLGITRPQPALRVVRRHRR